MAPGHDWCMHGGAVARLRGALSTSVLDQSVHGQRFAGLQQKMGRAGLDHPGRLGLVFLLPEPSTCAGPAPPSAHPLPAPALQRKALNHPHQASMPKVGFYREDNAVPLEMHKVGAARPSPPANPKPPPCALLFLFLTPCDGRCAHSRACRGI